MIIDMNIPTSTIIPVTKARGKLGALTEKISKDNYIILTKGGNPKAALVDIGYLDALQRDVIRIYQKTFIDPKLLDLTREFSDKEIDEWLENDNL